MSQKEPQNHTMIPESLPTLASNIPAVTSQLKSPKYSLHSLKTPKSIRDREHWIQRKQNEAIFLNLNSIILQYLEVSGLDQAYKTFYDECQMLGYPLPNHYPSEPSASVGICHGDVELLLEYFDSGNGNALLELWQTIVQTVNSIDCPETIKITVYINVYVALIPFRKNLSEDEKLQAMQRLKDYFQIKANECTTDEEVLTCFALPFVPDPKSHPVFCRLLNDAWADKLRLRLKALALTWCSRKTSRNPLETDLAQLLSSWSSGVDQVVKTSDGKTWKLHSTLQPVTLTSGATNDFIEFYRDTPIKIIVREMEKMGQESKSLKEDVKQLKRKLSDQIEISTALTEYITGACSNTIVDINKIRSITSNVFDMKEEPTTTSSRESSSKKKQHNVMSEEKACETRQLGKSNQGEKVNGDQFKQETHKGQDVTPRPQIQDIKASEFLPQENCSNRSAISNRSNKSSDRCIRKFCVEQPDNNLESDSKSSRLVTSTGSTSKSNSSRKFTKRYCSEDNDKVALEASLKLHESIPKICIPNPEDQEIIDIRRPRTYEVEAESPKSGRRNNRMIASSEENCTILSARPGTTNLVKTNITRRSKTQNPNSPGPGKTYRVRCIDTQPKSLYIPHELNIKDDSIIALNMKTKEKNHQTMKDSTRNDNRSLVEYPPSSLRQYRCSDQSPRKNCSGRGKGDFSNNKDTPTKQLRSRGPGESNVSGHTSTQLSSWHTSSHTADYIEIKADKPARMSKQRTCQKAAIVNVGRGSESKIRRSLSETNTRSKIP